VGGFWDVWARWIVNNWSTTFFFFSCVWLLSVYSVPMIQATIEEGRPAPAPRVQDPAQRLSPELRNLAPGKNVLLERRAAIALRAYGRYHGWRMVQQVEEGEDGTKKVRVWRVE
jgi:hypothetical protein